MSNYTRRGYDTCWNRWEIFCSIRREPPLMYGESGDMRWLEEEQTSDFIVHLAKTMSRTAGTVKNYLAAIGTEHAILGLERPMDRMKRVKLAMRGLRKVQGATTRKHPVTPAMLCWIEGELDLSKADDAVVWAGISTGWFFLLRCSEFCAKANFAPDN